VAGHDDVLYLKHLHCKLKNGQEVDVRGGSLVRHIPVHKHLTWFEAADLVGRDSGVRAANPEIVRLLDAHQRIEEVRILLEDCLGPLSVLSENLVEIVHVGSPMVYP
jgi:hypothetical protein